MENHLMSIRPHLMSLSHFKISEPDLKAKFDEQKKELTTLQADIKRSRTELQQEIKELESLKKKANTTEPAEQQQVTQKIENIKTKRKSFLDALEATQKMEALTKTVDSLKRELEESRAEKNPKRAKAKPKEQTGTKRTTESPSAESPKAKPKPTQKPPSSSRGRSPPPEEQAAASSSNNPPPPPKPKPTKRRVRSNIVKPTAKPEVVEPVIAVSDKPASVEPTTKRRTRGRVHIIEPTPVVNIDELKIPLPKAKARAKSKSRSRSTGKKSKVIDPENPFEIGIHTTVGSGSGIPPEHKQNPLPCFDTANDGYYIKL